MGFRNISRGNSAEFRCGVGRETRGRDFRIGAGGQGHAAVKVRVRYLRLAIFLLLALTPVVAKDANFVFEPGKSLGSASLGQAPDAMLKGFSGWTYDIEPYAIGDVYHFPKTGPQQFLISFTTDHKLKGITILDKSCRMKGVPAIGPGCSKEAVLKQFGKPTRDTLDKFGGYWDYDAKGICFHFPSSRETPRFGVGKIDAISLYTPGTSRFK